MFARPEGLFKNLRNEHFLNYRACQGRERESRQGVHNKRNARLIIPAVQRKEVVFHERGLVCLGLCSLIERNLALQPYFNEQH
ncbi:hypothetical protein JOM56_000234 [Amanita muscaria]